MKQKNDTKEWTNAFLMQNDNRSLFVELSKAIYNSAKRKNLSIEFLGTHIKWHEISDKPIQFFKTEEFQNEIKTRGTESVETFDSVLKQIQSELYLFLNEKEKEIKACFDSGNFHPTSTEDSLELAKILKTWFIRHWIESTRRVGSDRYRYLQKRIADILRSSGDIFTQSPGKSYTKFSLVADSRQIHPLSAEDIESIEFPNGLTNDYDEINKKESILALSEYFWNKVSTIYGNIPVWITIRDFLKWLGCFVSFDRPEVKEAFIQNSKIFDNAYDVYALKNKYFDTEQEFFKKTVIDYAAQFYERMTALEKTVFYEKFALGSRHKDIAVKMGLNGPPRVTELLNSIESKLRFFLRDLKNLSPEDIDDDAFDLFMEALKNFLKKDVSVP